MARRATAKKTDMTSFSCKAGKGQGAMLVRVDIVSNNIFELYINERKFGDIRNDYYIKKSRSYSRA